MKTRRRFAAAWLVHVLFVAVEVVDWRFELNGLDHLPRAERIQVGAAVRRVGSARNKHW